MGKHRGVGVTSSISLGHQHHHHHHHHHHNHQQQQQQQQQQEEEEEYAIPNTLRSIRKRKRAGLGEAAGLVKTKCQRVNNTNGNNNYVWHENDDEDSSSNDADAVVTEAVMHTPTHTDKQLLNNSSLLLNATLNASFVRGNVQNTSGATESPKPVYTLRPSVVNGTILHDLKSKPWRLGRPIGKGNFGEIFLASDNVTLPVSNENAKYVVKVEPHSNGPLFVEIHCLMNTANFNKNADHDVANESQEQASSATCPLNDVQPSGIPDYIATGSHFFDSVRYRFLVLPRFDRDLHSLIKNTRVQQKSLLSLAINVVNVLENLHDRGYCHNDIKAQNLMISKCKYLKKQVPVESSTKKTQQYDEHYDEKQQTTDSGNSSEQEVNDEYYEPADDKLLLKRNLFEDDDDDEDFDDGATTNSNNSVDIYQTPVNKKRVQRRRRNNQVEFSGSNPVRSCRREKRHSIYEEMVKSHYLRPTKRISYSELFNEDGMPVKDDSRDAHHSSTSDDDANEEFLPPNKKRSAATTNKKSMLSKSSIAVKGYQQHLRQEKVPTRSSKRSATVISKEQTSTSIAELVPVEEDCIFLIDFGLASKYQDRGVHRPFIMDQRRAHDGTLEFTSRDAHLGAHSRRSDLECLGYNLLYWSQGFLPWKEAAMQQQQEKVHRSKELLMTDVREMLQQIYGKQVPKYLGEFLHCIGQLGYQERPDYEGYRKIFMLEYRRLGFNCNEMQLNSNEILRTCVRFKDEPDGLATPKCSDIFELNNSNLVRRNSALTTPFQDHSFTNRVSPKNLRSKSSKKNTKKSFSWTEVLSQDPDQIARERAVKEFEREEGICPLKSRKSRQYEGKPTYAILHIQHLLRLKGRFVDDGGGEEQGNLQQDQAEEQEEEDTYAAESCNEGEETDEESEIAESTGTEHEEKLDIVKSSKIPRGGKHRKGAVKKRITKDISPREDNSQRSRRRVGASVKYNTKTRSSKVKPTAVSEPDIQGANTKRNPRKAYNPAASAAGEVELQNKGQLSNEGDCHEQTAQQRERRTRRCLPKTEPVGAVLDEDSNSNFGPDMHGLLNIWNKFDNESIYVKGHTAAAVGVPKYARK